MSSFPPRPCHYCGVVDTERRLHEGGELYHYACAHQGGIGPFGPSLPERLPVAYDPRTLATLRRRQLLQARRANDLRVREQMNARALGEMNALIRRTKQQPQQAVSRWPGLARAGIVMGQLTYWPVGMVLVVVGAWTGDVAVAANGALVMLCWSLTWRPVAESFRRMFRIMRGQHGSV